MDHAAAPAQKYRQLFPETGILHRLKQVEGHGKLLHAGLRGRLAAPEKVSLELRPDLGVFPGDQPGDVGRDEIPAAEPDAAFDQRSQFPASPRRVEDVSGKLHHPQMAGQLGRKRLKLFRQEQGNAEGNTHRSPAS